MGKKVKRIPGSATITSRSQSPTPRGREKGKKLTRAKNTHTQNNNKETNARGTHRPVPSSPSEVITMLKQDMTQHETHRSKNHKATQTKNHTRITVLERSVASALYGGLRPRPTTAIQCARRLSHSYLHETTKINFQFLKDVLS